MIYKELKHKTICPIYGYNVTITGIYDVSQNPLQGSFHHYDCEIHSIVGREKPKHDKLRTPYCNRTCNFLFPKTWDFGNKTTPLPDLLRKNQE